MSIKVIKLSTGEVTQYEGKLMVAPNGMVFIKSGSRTVFATASTDYSFEEVL